MGIVSVAECNSCGKREDTKVSGITVYPPIGWVYMTRPINLMGLVTEDRYLVCSSECLVHAYEHSRKSAKRECT